jgi:hypothetical protein
VFVIRLLDGEEIRRSENDSLPFNAAGLAAGFAALSAVAGLVAQYREQVVYPFSRRVRPPHAIGT